MLVPADNPYTLWINGKEVHQGADWQTPDEFSIKEYLKQGDNVIALSVNNSEAGPAGLIAAVRLQSKDGKAQEFVLEPCNLPPDAVTLTSEPRVAQAGEKQMGRMLMEHFGLAKMEQLVRVVGDDFRYLHQHYAGRLRFCGGVCVQSTLASGTPAEVVAEDRRRLELFPQGGLFRGPTHAIQVGAPLVKARARYRTAGSLCQRIVDKILAVGEDSAGASGINLSKLF